MGIVLLTGQDGTNLCGETFGTYRRKGEKARRSLYKGGHIKIQFLEDKNGQRLSPTKETALALAVALRLDLDETADIIKRAEYTLSHSRESDLIVEFFIEREMYNIDEINYQLDYRGHKTPTNWRKSKDEQ